MYYTVGALDGGGASRGTGSLHINFASRKTTTANIDLSLSSLDTNVEPSQLNIQIVAKNEHGKLSTAAYPFLTAWKCHDFWLSDKDLSHHDSTQIVARRQHRVF
jgi:hypothetical protein